MNKDNLVRFTGYLAFCLLFASFEKGAASAQIDANMEQSTSTTGRVYALQVDKGKGSLIADAIADLIEGVNLTSVGDHLAHLNRINLGLGEVVSCVLAFESLRPCGKNGRFGESPTL